MHLISSHLGEEIRRIQLVDVDGEGVTDDMVGEVIEFGFAPAHPLGMRIGINIICASVMAVIFDPAFVGSTARSPIDHGAFTGPGVVVILGDVIEIAVRVGQSFRIALAEHDDVRVFETGECGFGCEPLKNTFHGIAARLVSEN